MVPFFILAAVLMKDIAVWGQIVPALIFGLAAFTDMLDGKIARKYNLITDFGKFIDPLADKFMVFGALIAILAIDTAIAPVFVWVCAIVMFRELAVTSMRLVVANKSGVVIAASFLGKLKTVSQIVCILLLILDPWIITFIPVLASRVVSYVAMGVMTITTVFSGIDYFRVYLPLIDTNQ